MRNSKRIFLIINFISSKRGNNMRVIAGSAKRLILETIDGMETRPTTDRIKETLFNMLNPYLQGCYFLDLFSGSGAIGIEALSRGAKKAWFVESQKKPVECIKRNLIHTKLESKAQVMMMDAVTAIRQLKTQGITFDYIHMDPPYGKDLERQVLMELKDSCLVGEETEIIIESDLDTQFDYVESLGFRVIKEKIYKTNKHVFICR